MRSPPKSPAQRQTYPKRRRVTKPARGSFEDRKKWPLEFATMEAFMEWKERLEKERGVQFNKQATYPAEVSGGLQIDFMLDWHANTIPRAPGAVLYLCSRSGSAMYARAMVMSTERRGSTPMASSTLRSERRSWATEGAMRPSRYLHHHAAVSL